MPEISMSSDTKSRSIRRSRSVDDDAEVMHKHSVVLSGHRTSVSLESIFWNALRQIADGRGQSVNRLVEMVDSTRTTNLSSAIRVYILKQYKSAGNGKPI